MTFFQYSELTELPVVENSQIFAQRAHSARYAPKHTPDNSIVPSPQTAGVGARPALMTITSHAVVWHGRVGLQKPTSDGRKVTRSSQGMFVDPRQPNCVLCCGCQADTPPPPPPPRGTGDTDRGSGSCTLPDRKFRTQFLHPHLRSVAFFLGGG